MSSHGMEERLDLPSRLASDATESKGRQERFRADGEWARLVTVARACQTRNVS